MQRNIADAFISFLKERFSADTDDALASALNLSKSTVASWRRRNVLPRGAKGAPLVEADEFLRFYYRYVADRLLSVNTGDKIILTAALATRNPGAQLGELASWMAANRRRILAELARQFDPMSDTRTFSDYDADSIAMAIVWEAGRAPDSIARFVMSLREQEVPQ